MPYDRVHDVKSPAAMSGVAVCGWGAVSPAGWGVLPMVQAIENGLELPAQQIPRPGSIQGPRVRAVPPPRSRPEFLGHPRLRRSSAITHYAVAAALEAAGRDRTLWETGQERLGIILCTLTGSVNYSRRFYHEVLENPATASPVLFPETVFNAPASHLAAFLGATLDYTLAGDTASFLQGLGIATDWLKLGLVEGCLVIGAEEKDWITADALRLFHRGLITSEGAGALYLKRDSSLAPAVRLESTTEAFPFTDPAAKQRACALMRTGLPHGVSTDLLCDSVRADSRLDQAEIQAWTTWPGQRVSPRKVLGEGWQAASAWQCVLVSERLRNGPSSAALVSMAGYSDLVAGAHFRRVS